MAGDIVGNIGFAVWLGVIGLFFSFGLFMYVKSQPVGNEKMAELSEAIHSGAMAFLRREYTVLLPFIIVVRGPPVLARGPAHGGGLRAGRGLLDPGRLLRDEGGDGGQRPHLRGGARGRPGQGAPGRLLRRAP